MMKLGRNAPQMLANKSFNRSFNRRAGLWIFNSDSFGYDNRLLNVGSFGPAR